MSLPMTHCDLFVVRIWHQIAGGFRASVRRVDEEVTRHFTQPEEVASFLASVSQAEPEAPEPAPPSDPSPPQP